VEPWVADQPGLDFRRLVLGRRPATIVMTRFNTDRFRVNPRRDAPTERSRAALMVTAWPDRRRRSAVNSF
jgi:hypothetical protein